MITIEIMGGLGNQLFQIFTLLSYSLTNKIPFYFENKRTININRPFYWNNLLSSLSIFIKEPINLPIYKESGIHYSQIPYCEHFKLFGYFQSYKYFIENTCAITRLLKIKESQDLIVGDYSNKVSLHFRIGDYKNLQKYHPLLTVDYYKKALNQLLEDTKKTDWCILYFYEKDDINAVESIINELKGIFTDLHFESISHNVIDWEQMLMMSKCQHNIIANSSFSWWGSYLNINNNNTYYPSVWFGPDAGYKNTNDMYPDSWTKILSETHQAVP